MDEKCVCHINGYRLKDTEARRKATTAGEMANAAMEKAIGFEKQITEAVTTANRAKNTADGAVVTAKAAYTTAAAAEGAAAKAEENAAAAAAAAKTAAAAATDAAKAASGQDWNQNDPAAPDYIKNRPFYSMEKWELVHEKKTVQFEYDDHSGIWAGIYNDDKGPFFDMYSEYLGRARCKLVVNGVEYVSTFNYAEEDGVAYFGNPTLIPLTPHMGGLQTAVNDTGEEFVVVRCCASDMGIALKGVPAAACEVSMYICLGSEYTKIPAEFLPNGKPLLLNAASAETYLNDPAAGDEAMEAIKTGRQILVRVPNASGDNYVASYSPVYMYQVPNQTNSYLYLFFLRDEKQDLSALLGQPAGTVLMPVYGQLKMKLSQEHNKNPLET